MASLTERVGKRLPFLRWSFIRMGLGMKRLTTEWQVGDGREAALADYVVANAPAGDLDAAIGAVDEFAYEPEVPDQRRRREGRDPRRRDPAEPNRDACSSWAPTAATARCGPPGRCRRARTCGRSSSTPTTPRSRGASSAHAGVADRVTVVLGTLGDGGATIAALEGEHGFAAGLPRLRLHRPRQGGVPPGPPANPRPGLAPPRLRRGGRQRQVPRRARLPRLYERT